MAEIICFLTALVVYPVLLFNFACGLTEEQSERDRITFDLIDRMKEASERENNNEQH